uniref:Uncharacterized protein n=1 Tax=Anguilla anguilla TaxID=7936 RepID=A0A0E9R4J3_ANGAN
MQGCRFDALIWFPCQLTSVTCFDMSGNLPLQTRPKNISEYGHMFS